jgi:hypothetical protein
MDEVEHADLRQDMSLHDFLKQRNISERGMRFANIRYAQTSALSMDHLSTQGCQREVTSSFRSAFRILLFSAFYQVLAFELHSSCILVVQLAAFQDRNWEFGDQNFHLIRSYSEFVLDYCISGLTNCTLHTDWCLESVTQSEPRPASPLGRAQEWLAATSNALALFPLGALQLARAGASMALSLVGRQQMTTRLILQNSRGESIEADRVVMAVPLTVLQNDAIKFSPALPQSKVSAISRIKMTHGHKCIAAFKERLWPLDCGLIFCDNSSFSQVREWLRSRLYCTRAQQNVSMALFL